MASAPANVNEPEQANQQENSQSRYITQALPDPWSKDSLLTSLPSFPFPIAPLSLAFLPLTAIALIHDSIPTCADGSNPLTPSHPHFHLSAPAAVEAGPAAFEVTLLVPAQTFLSPKGAAAPSAALLELPIPISAQDAVHELRQIIVESPEGFWLGAFSLVPVSSKLLAPAVEQAEGVEAQPAKWADWEELVAPEPEKAQAGQVDSKAWRLTSEGVLGDYADLAAVFDGEWEGRKRGLKVQFSKRLPR